MADSLSGLEVPSLAAARRIADLGAGAGFPGLVLAVALPTARVDLIESSRRKAAVIDRLIQAARIENARSVVARAEEWARLAPSLGGGREAYDAVTARAVASLPVLVEYAAPLLRVSGVLVAWKGRLWAPTNCGWGGGRLTRWGCLSRTCCGSSRSLPPAIGICACFGRWRLRPSGFRGGLGWRRSGRSVERRARVPAGRPRTTSNNGGSLRKWSYRPLSWGTPFSDFRLPGRPTLIARRSQAHAGPSRSEANKPPMRFRPNRLVA